jgi:propionyl-CoA synthetase
VIPYKPFVDEALQLSKAKVNNVVVVQRPQAKASLVAGRDWNWHEIMKDPKRAVLTEPVNRRF